MSSFFVLKFSNLFASLQKEERLRASTHQETIHLREKQNQRGPSALYQGPSSDEEGEASKSHGRGERRGESGEEVTVHHLRSMGAIMLWWALTVLLLFT